MKGTIKEYYDRSFKQKTRLLGEWMTIAERDGIVAEHVESGKTAAKIAVLLKMSTSNVARISLVRSKLLAEGYRYPIKAKQFRESVNSMRLKNTLFVEFLGRVWKDKHKREQKDDMFKMQNKKSSYPLIMD